MLVDLGVTKLDVIGRPQSASSNCFLAKTGIKPLESQKAWIQEHNAHLNQVFAIVAVSADQLASTAVDLMQAGVRHILLEKPAGLDISSVERVARVCRETSSSVCRRLQSPFLWLNS